MTSSNSPADPLAGDRLVVGVRAFALPLGARLSRKRKKRRQTQKSPAIVARWPEGVLTFDCETDGTPAQRLLYGYYQTGWWRTDRRTGDPYIAVWREGWFYEDDLPTRDPEGFATLQAYYERTRAALPPKRRSRIHLCSRREFVDRVFYPVGYKGKALIVGFNLPFDLSRIAEEWSTTRKYKGKGPGAGAFSFRMTHWKDGRPNRYLPRVLITHVDRTRAMMRFAGVKASKKWPG